MRMSRRRFTELTRQAYGELPPAIAARLENLDIIVADAPGPEAEGAMEDADGGSGGGLLGLYVGVPRTERYGDGPALPDCIYIYRRPILAMCDTPAAAAAEIRITLRHEIGHYLGMDEPDLERLGYG